MGLNQPVEKAIETARSVLECDGDSNLAIYILRDLPEVRRADLTDIAWAMYQHGTCEREVKWFISKLEATLW